MDVVWLSTTRPRLLTLNWLVGGKQANRHDTFTSSRNLNFRGERLRNQTALPAKRCTLMYCIWLGTKRLWMIVLSRLIFYIVYTFIASHGEKGFRKLCVCICECKASLPHCHCQWKIYRCEVKRRYLYSTDLGDLHKFVEKLNIWWTSAILLTLFWLG